MTKSAVDLAREAMRVGGEALPAYASKYSRRDYTLAQLFAVLVLRRFLKTDYRGVVALLAEWSDLRRVLKLSKVPDHSTLWHVEQKLAKKGLSIACSPPALLEPGVSA
jgi:Transposase domain (DUF772)